MRPGAERLNDRCDHGVRMDPDPNVIACTLCRFLLGEVPTVEPPRPRLGRCQAIGHEPYPRRNCPACASELAENRTRPSRPTATT